MLCLIKGVPRGQPLGKFEQLHLQLPYQIGLPFSCAPLQALRKFGGKSFGRVRIKAMQTHCKTCAAQNRGHRKSLFRTCDTSDSNSNLLTADWVWRGESEDGQERRRTTGRRQVSDPALLWTGLAERALPEAIAPVVVVLFSLKTAVRKPQRSQRPQKRELE